LSRTPTRSTPSSSTQIEATNSSIGRRGSTCSTSAGPRAVTGFGNALRSTLPFGFSGTASIATIIVGIEYVGSRSAR
jgi:hypothetical protein